MPLSYPSFSLSFDLQRPFLFDVTAWKPIRCEALCLFLHTHSLSFSLSLTLSVWIWICAYDFRIKFCQLFSTTVNRLFIHSFTAMARWLCVVYRSSEPLKKQRCIRRGVHQHCALLVCAFDVLFTVAFMYLVLHGIGRWVSGWVSEWARVSVSASIDGCRC